MTDQERITYFERITKGLAIQKKAPRPQIKDWDKRRRPMRYKWAKLPPFAPESPTGYDKAQER